MGICFINELPPETLMHIFEFGSIDDGFGQEHDKDVPQIDTRARGAEMVQRGENEGGDGESGFDDTGSFATAVPFAFVASHVCQHWRNVALSTPSLWTTIAVAPEERRPYERVSTVLERGKDFLIDISVRYEDAPDQVENPPSIDDNLGFLFAMLIPHIHRWRTMKVTVSDYRLMYAFLRTVSDPAVPAASRLTTLELYDQGRARYHDLWDQSGLWDHFTLFGGSAPLLTRIVLYGVHVDWDQPWIASASNLRELELTYHSASLRPSLHQFITILRNASTVQKLTLCRSGPTPDEFMETPSPPDFDVPIQLLRVTDLELAFMFPSRATWLIQKFIFPALENLVLHFYRDTDYTRFVQALARPAISSSPTQELRSLLSGLESLKIAGLSCRTECIQTLYGELQNLVSLAISMANLDPLLLDVLSTPCTLPGRGGVWLPRLTTLYVSDTSGSTLREVVSKRKEMGVPLGSLYVEEDCDVYDEDVAWLKDNVSRFEFFKERDDDVGSDEQGGRWPP